jgi:UDP-N-acetyl-D-glucosamine dehydrogenase
MKVCIIGLGYVGLPLAVRAAEVGHSVVGIDVDKRKIDTLRTGTSYIEDVTDDRLRAAASVGMTFNHELLLSHGGFDVCVVTVPTPLRDDQPDLSYVISAAEAIGRAMQPHIVEPGAAVVLESTTFPGTTEGIFRETIEQYSTLTAGKDFHLGFSPERIDPGPSSPHTLENTPKLVSGTTPEALAKIQAFYDTIVETTVPVSSPRVAEMTKCFENIQAYVNIGLINELAGICHDLDIDVWEMVDASMTKGHSMSRWTPGPGVGGHCLPIDGQYVAWLTREELNYPFRFAELAAEVNNGRPRYVVDRACELLAERDILPRQANVLIMGLAYKPSVGDLRESPALPIVDDLIGRGVTVTVIDPLVDTWTKTPRLYIEELPGALKNYDLVINVTNHDVFDYDKVAREAQQVLDCRNSMRASDTVVPL